MALNICPECQTNLPAGTLVCPACNEKDFLRGRTAGGKVCGDAPVEARPYFAAPRPKRTIPAWVWVALSISALLVGCLGLAGWAGYKAWMRGPGGDIAFNQHNRVGNIAYQEHDFARANEEYSQMIALRPRLMAGYLLRGMTLHSLGRFHEAIQDDTTALALPDGRSDAADLYSNRANAESRVGLYPAEIADLTRGLSLYTRFRRSEESAQVYGYIRTNYQQRAAAYTSLHQDALAVADYDTIIRSYAPSPEDFALRGSGLAALGKNAAALADFEQGVRLDPNNPDAYNAEGNFLEKSHQYVAAITLWQRARRSCPENSSRNGNWWGSLGWYQYEAGQFPQAIQSDQKALDAERAQGWVRYNMGLCYAAQGNRAASTASYAMALLHSAEPDRKAALEDLKTALVKQPRSPVLLQVQQQLQGAQARKTPFPRLARIQRPLSQGIPEAIRPINPAEITLGDYRIVPPTGYQLTQTKFDASDGTGTTYLWSGLKRRDSTQPTLEIVIGQREGGSISDENTSEWKVQMALSVAHARHLHFTPSPLEQMTIGGQPFTYARWKGVGQKTGKLFEGDEYASVASGTALQISTHDAVPYSQATLSVLQKSVLTFRHQ